MTDFITVLHIKLFKMLESAKSCPGLTFHKPQPHKSAFQKVIV